MCRVRQSGFVAHRPKLNWEWEFGELAKHESSCDVTSFHGCGRSLSSYNLISVSVSAFIFVAFAVSDSVAVVSLWLLMLLLLLHRVARCLYSRRS